jgi:hypothetical protein
MSTETKEWILLQERTREEDRDRRRRQQDSAQDSRQVFSEKTSGPKMSSILNTVIYFLPFGRYMKIQY